MECCFKRSFGRSFCSLPEGHLSLILICGSIVCCLSRRQKSSVCGHSDIHRCGHSDIHSGAFVNSYVEASSILLRVDRSHLCASLKRRDSFAVIQISIVARWIKQELHRTIVLGILQLLHSSVGFVSPTVRQESTIRERALALSLYYQSKQEYR